MQRWGLSTSLCRERCKESCRKSWALCDDKYRIWSKEGTSPERVTLEVILTKATVRALSPVDVDVETEEDLVVVEEEE